VIHRDLFRMLVPAGIVCLACSVFGWIGLIAPNLLGWPASTPLVARVLLSVLAAMPLLWFLAFRLHLRSLWVYRNTSPVAMNVDVKIEEDSDSTQYYALLRVPGDGHRIERVPVFPPRWDVGAIGKETPARVFIDPRSSKPSVIEIDGKRLWTMGAD
jgi:hypothetical protein